MSRHVPVEVVLPDESIDRELATYIRTKEFGIDCTVTMCR